MRNRCPREDNLEYFLITCVHILLFGRFRNRLLRCAEARGIELSSVDVILLLVTHDFLRFQCTHRDDNVYTRFVGKPEHK